MNRKNDFSLPEKPKKIPSVYLDFSASAPMSSHSYGIFSETAKKTYANPSSIHALGQKSAEVVGLARNRVADALGTNAKHIFFTSGGTESCNLAILGFARKNKEFGNHIITSEIEHPAVSGPIAYLEKQGCRITRIAASKDGRISEESVLKAITSKTFLISIQSANNEIGTVQPIREIGLGVLQYRKKHNTRFPFFHSDACQIPPFLPIRVNALHVDFLSLNASKMYGPKGMGILFKGPFSDIEPLQYGGGQETGMRSGTENIPGIAATGMAFFEYGAMNEKIIDRVRNLRDLLYAGLKKIIPDIELNGPSLEVKGARLPHNLHVYIPGIEGEKLVLYASAYGMYFSTGSACGQRKNETVNALTALGYVAERGRSSVRFTLGKSTNEKQIRYTIEYTGKLIRALRSIRMYE